MNLFAYCGNNPVNRLDSDGKDWRSTCLFGLTVAAVGLFVLATLPFSGPALVGAGVTAATVATVASETTAVGLTVAGGSLIAGFSKESKKSGKERASDKPSYANRDMVDPKQSAQNNAKRIMDEKWGEGNWKSGPGSDYNKILKWIERHVFRT